MNEDRYLEDFATVAGFFLVCVLCGLAMLALIFWWVWEV